MKMNQEVVYEICTKDSISNHAAGLLQNCSSLLSNNELVDCTIVCKDGQLQAHKVILAASCKYMHEMLTCTSLPSPCSHPMIFLRKWKIEDFKTVLDYMYTAKATIRQTKLATILKICDELEYLALAKAVVKATSKSRSSTSIATVLPLSPRINPTTTNTNSNLVNQFGESRTKKVNRSSSQPQELTVIPVSPSSMELGNRNGHDFGSSQFGGTSPSEFIKTESFEKSEIESAEDDEEDFVNYDTQPVPQVPPSLESMSNGSKRQREADNVQDKTTKRLMLSSNGTSQNVSFGLNGHGTHVKLELDEDDNETGEDEHDDEGLGLVNPEELLEVNHQDGTEDGHSQCPWCHETFTSVALFQRHLRTHVNKCRPYSCEYCNTSFARSAHLKRHRRTHTGEKPYICTVCQRAFARQDKLKGHMERHLQQTTKNENFLSSTSINNNNSNSNDALTITSFSTNTTPSNQIPIKVLIPTGKVGRSSKTPSSNHNSTPPFKKYSADSLLIGNANTNGNRFEIGSTTSNGLSISLASSDFSESREKSKFSGGGGLTVTPASRPSPAYLQSLTSRGVGSSFANGDFSKSNKSALNYVSNYNS